MIHFPPLSVTSLHDVRSVAMGFLVIFVCLLLLLFSLLLLLLFYLVVVVVFVVVLVSRPVNHFRTNLTFSQNYCTQVHNTNHKISNF